MESNSRARSKFILRQIDVTRRNLIHICSLAVKMLVDKSCIESIDESCDEVANFCAILEHILNFRLRPNQKWFGPADERWFWDYVQVACRKIPHNCLASVENMENPKTSKGKGRAWLKMALMEKRLSEYLSAAIQQSKLTKSFYQDSSIMLSEDATMLTGIMLGLNAIDFSFDLRSENLDAGGLSAIDYTPYLMFHQSLESQHSDVLEESRLNAASERPLSYESFDDVNLQELTLQARCNQLTEKYRVLSEQKGYLEELVRLREGQMEEGGRQRQRLVDTLQHYESESRRERHQLETVIIELQSQLASLKTENESHRRKLELLDKSGMMKRPPGIRLSGICQDMALSGDGYNQGDCASNTGQSASPSYNIADAKEDTQSTMALAGSFTEAPVSASYLAQQVGAGSTAGPNGGDEVAKVTTTAVVHNQTSLDDPSEEITMEPLVPILTVSAHVPSSSPKVTKNSKTSTAKNTPQSNSQSSKGPQTPPVINTPPTEQREQDTTPQAENTPTDGQNSSIPAEDLVEPADDVQGDVFSKAETPSKPDLLPTCEPNE